MSDRSPEAVGIDVGGTKIAAARVSSVGEILARAVVPSPADDTDAIVEAMVAAAVAVGAQGVTAVGISAAGMVEIGTGIMRFAPNLAWRDADLRARVGTPLGLPTVVENDNNAAAWGEFRFGVGRGHRHVLFVGVGTGIGGGIVADGALLRGAHGFAAEIGHFVVQPDGERCGCGNRGCWETVASGSAITREARKAVARHPHSRIAELAEGDPDRATGSMVTRAAREGDPAATGILAEVGHRLGEGIGGLVNILDPEIVIVGGGAAAAGDLLLAPARVAFRMSVEAPDHRPDVPIVAAGLGADAGVIGAAVLALDGTPVAP
ncbi:MAG TPA: ROK family protein [Actinomycetota bacterium]